MTTRTDPRSALSLLPPPRPRRGFFLRGASPAPGSDDKPGMPPPDPSNPPAETPLSPRAAALHARLRELDRSDDALELRIAVAVQQRKAAEARAECDPAAALDRINEVQHRLRRAG